MGVSYSVIDAQISSVTDMLTEMAPGKKGLLVATPKLRPDHVYLIYGIRLSSGIYYMSKYDTNSHKWDQSGISASVPVGTIHVINK